MSGSHSPEGGTFCSAVKIGQLVQYPFSIAKDYEKYFLLKANHFTTCRIITFLTPTHVQ